MNRAIRELDSNDINQIIRYFLQADEGFLRSMGVDPHKLPDASVWKKLIEEDLAHSIADKQFYYLIWELNHHPVGHSNINKIIFGQEAYMHLHLWQACDRKTGHGLYFIQQSISKYFEAFNLQWLVCEPCTLNPAPNKMLEKVGFELVKSYETTPGWINFQQTVNRWVLSRAKWLRATVD